MGKLLKCTLCNKPVIERTSNGTWRFIFGDSIGSCIGTVVELEAIGILRIKCLRRSCRREHPDHWNEFNIFEINQSSSSPKTD